ncbi:MAG: AI-2E family transporter [Alphaproteobacteria bacterium]|nr:AI-2E family transporter [Alphaproteobacteria bacterium]
MSKEQTQNHKNKTAVDKAAKPANRIHSVRIAGNHNAIAWLVIFILFCVAVYVLRSVLMPFVAGIVLGYLFDPLASRFEKWGMSRMWATLLVFAVVILIAVPAIILLFGMLNEQLTVFVEAAPNYISAFVKRTEPMLVSLQEQFPSLEIANIKAMIKDNMTTGLQFSGKLLKGLVSNGFALINLISLLLITPVVAFYMLRDWDTFVKKVDNLLPRKSKNVIREQFRQIDRALSGFIRGQLSVCLILGTYYSLGLKFVGLDLGILVGFLAGLISFIPYVGSISGFVISIILALAQFNDYTKVLEVIAVFAVGQFVEGNFLTPKLVGDNVGLHPVWVMFALLAGGVLLGFLGLMIAVPVAAIIGVLMRYTINNYKKSSLYLED